MIICPYCCEKAPDLKGLMSKYKNYGDPPTRAIEECSELIQALCKGKRFGWFNYHPNTPEISNIDQAINESRDVIGAVHGLSRHLAYIKSRLTTGGN